MLGDQIRALREAKCWSQAHLADAARLNVRTVQRIEAGEPCSYETMMSLAAALSVDVSTFEQEVPVPKNTLSGFVGRPVLAAVCLMPALLFIGLNLLRSIGGVTGPYDAVASAGSKFITFQTFNVVTPFIFIGGAAVALLASVPAFLRIRGKFEGGALSITALEVKTRWTTIVLAAAALCSLVTLVAYVALEALLTTLH